ncbi:hypothetical protein A0H81_05114 [Grifola frondosa]|uniref:BTB domain-containing protein n=1 Tax=Grifola frondosa TaxID=5627 RepID=A0A1C7MDL0_GRIFR|nr:hypothetical protein A0H81_05114 [Grifola frondosa]
MRDEVFHLSHDQISSDAPNYFTSCFLGGFVESEKRTLTLDRNPALFALIVDYLSGYTILPLSIRALPHTMDVPVALRNLLQDAQFFGLRGLCDLLTLPKPDFHLVVAGFANEVVALQDVLRKSLPEGVVLDDGALVSAHTKLPVLIFAQDVILRIVVDKVIDAATEGEVVPTKRTLSFEIEVPSTSRHPQSFIPNSSSATVKPVALVATTAEPDAILHIDGVPYGFREFFGWCKHHSGSGLHPGEMAIHDLWNSILSYITSTLPQTGSAGRRKILRQSVMLWTDELLCCVPERGATEDAVVAQHVSIAGESKTGGGRFLDGNAFLCGAVIFIVIPDSWIPRKAGMGHLIRILAA